MRAPVSLAIAVAMIAPGLTLAADGLSTQRKSELRHLLQQDCGSCHGITMKGGLGSPLLPSVIAEKADEALIEAILHGVPGTPMPPWASELTRQDATWLVELLRDGAGK